MSLEFLITIIIFSCIFIGLPLMLFIIDRVSTFMDKMKMKKTYNDIILIPSGQVLKIDKYEFPKVMNKLIFWNKRISEWTVMDNSYFANQLKRKEYNG